MTICVDAKLDCTMLVVRIPMRVGEERPQLGRRDGRLLGASKRVGQGALARRRAGQGVRRVRRTWCRSSPMLARCAEDAAEEAPELAGLMNPFPAAWDRQRERFC